MFEIKTEARNIRLAHFHGKQNIDFWRKQYWKRKIDSADIIFFTTQVYLNCLRRGYVDLLQFKRVIFDECHNASKDHPFSLIMKEFYFEYK